MKKVTVRIVENHMSDMMMQKDSDGCDQMEMVLSNLDSLSKKAGQLMQMLTAHPGVEEWVQEKIAVAEYMIDSVYDYHVHSQRQHKSSHHKSGEHHLLPGTTAIPVTVEFVQED